MKMDIEQINKYLTMKRFFIFLDEWLTYLLLFILYSSGYYVIFGIAVVLAVIFNAYGYFSYWKVEEPYNDYWLKQIKKELEEKVETKKEVKEETIIS